MGRIPAGIMGGVYGKVGGIIGASWKGINYIKTYVIPSNPQSPAQTSQRAKMKLIVYIGKLILTSVIQPFWNPFATKMAGFHLFTSINLGIVEDDTDYESLLITKGSVEQVLAAYVTNIAYDSGTGVCTINWNEYCSGNGLSTDNIGIAVVDHANDVAFTSIGVYTRDDETGTLNIGTGRSLVNLAAYIFAYRGTGSELLVSDSRWIQNYVP